MIVALYQQGAPLVSAPADSAYTVVYDFSNATYHVWWPVYLFLALVPLLFAVDVLRNILAGRPAFTRRFLLGKLVLGVAIIAWQLNWIRMDHQGWDRVRSEYLAGRFEVVEGVVTDFQPETEQNIEETFTVNGHHYRYMSRMSGIGFNRSNLIGGPIRNGLHVRIRDMDGRILKLEIARL